MDVRVWCVFNRKNKRVWKRKIIWKKRTKEDEKRPKRVNVDSRRMKFKSIFARSWLKCDLFYFWGSSDIPVSMVGNKSDLIGRYRLSDSVISLSPQSKSEIFLWCNITRQINHRIFPLSNCCQERHMENPFLVFVACARLKSTELL